MKAPTTTGSIPNRLNAGLSIAGCCPGWAVKTNSFYAERSKNIRKYLKSGSKFRSQTAG